MQNRILALALVVACLITSSSLFADVPAPTFEAYQPQVLITPDNLPVMSWKDPGVDRGIDPSDLNKLELCTPGACPQEALDAGAAYYLILAGLIAYYDEYGRLVGTAEQIANQDAGSTYTAQAVAATETEADVPEGATLVGATPGAFEVLPSGAATYRIAIDIPPGTAGTQPMLALTYNSQGGNGLLGVGWTLEGLSAITRCPQTFAQDGNRTGITFTSTDRFCLDGKRLVTVPGSAPYGASGSEYRTELDSFSKIVAQNATSTGPSFFVVRTKSGEVIEYGRTADAAIAANNKNNTIATWALNKVTDSAGNYFEIEYLKAEAGGEYRPSLIKYTGNDTAGVAPYAKVIFGYGTRPDRMVGFVADASVTTGMRMTSIVRRVGTPAAETIAREYKLLYFGTKAEKPLSRLSHVQVCANDGSAGAVSMRCLPATSLAWDEYLAGFNGVGNTDRGANRSEEHTLDFIRRYRAACNEP